MANKGKGKGTKGPKRPKSSRRAVTPHKPKRRRVEPYHPKHPHLRLVHSDGDQPQEGEGSQATPVTDMDVYSASEVDMFRHAHKGLVSGQSAMFRWADFQFSRFERLMRAQGLLESSILSDEAINGLTDTAKKVQLWKMIDDSLQANVGLMERVIDKATKLMEVRRAMNDLSAQIPAEEEQQDTTGKQFTPEARKKLKARLGKIVHNSQSGQ